MKKNKGFTLVELVAVIIVLGLIALVTIPVIIEKLKTTKEDLFNDQIKIIEKSALNYAVDEMVHPSPDSFIYNWVISGMPGTSEITLLELQRNGAVDFNINNPLCSGDDSYFSPEDTKLTVTYDGKEFEFKVQNVDSLRTSCTAKR